MGIREDLKGALGIDGPDLHHNLSSTDLFHNAIANDRGRVRRDGPADEQKAYATKLGEQGPLVFYTNPDITGRPVRDTFCVDWPEVHDEIWWKADLQAFPADKIEALYERVTAHVNANSPRLYVQDLNAGWLPEYAIPLRFVGEYATHALFASNMFVSESVGIDDVEAKRWTILNVPSFFCEPERDGTRSECCVIIDIRHRRVLITGAADYCGINKKSIFTVLNYLLPAQGYLPMHASANIGKDGTSAILFGLSGTGKTTLSADPDRLLIGDDEHAWTTSGVSNFEGGCYAKLIDLNKDAEPVIAAALSMPGTVIENVPPVPGRDLADTDPQDLDLSDQSITENTRFSYPLSCNPGVAAGAKGPHPSTLVFLTADAFGVLPPVSVLDEDEVIFHFVSGFTAKLAGTEVGVTEPKAAFSACFGAPFMARPASVYAELLAQKVRGAKTRCILLNTGWTGGPYGIGQRISIKLTRAMLNAALRGDLHAPDMSYKTHDIFGLKMPTHCPGVPDEMLDPRTTWDDQEAYNAKARELKAMFVQNFEDKKFGELGIRNVMAG